MRRMTVILVVDIMVGHRGSVHGLVRLLESLLLVGVVESAGGVVRTCGSHDGSVKRGVCSRRMVIGMVLRSSCISGIIYIRRGECPVRHGDVKRVVIQECAPTAPLCGQRPTANMTRPVSTVFHHADASGRCGVALVSIACIAQPAYEVQRTVAIWCIRTSYDARRGTLKL